MKDFMVFYQHKDHGYCSIIIDADDILRALTYFSEKYPNVRIYGIMEVN